MTNGTVHTEINQGLRAGVDEFLAAPITISQRNLLKPEWELAKGLQKGPRMPGAFYHQATR